MAKRLLYVCAGLFLLALSYHLGARSAQGQAVSVRQLTHPPAGQADIQPTFSPDGTKIAFGRVIEGIGSLTDLYVADVSTGSTMVLASGLPPTWNPNGGIEWSPDGARIAIHDNGSKAIWIVEVNGPPITVQPQSWGQVKDRYRK